MYVCHMCLHSCACTKSYKCTFPCSSASACMQTHMLSPEVKPKFPFSVTAHLAFLDINDPVGRTSFLDVSLAGMTSKSYFFFFLTWKLGIKLKYLCLCDKDFRDRALSPAGHTILLVFLQACICHSSSILITGSESIV